MPLPSQNIPVLAGDTLAFGMYQNNASGGMSLEFTDGSNSNWYCGVDQYGACLKNMTSSNQWVNRVVKSGAFAAGKSLSGILIEDDEGAPQVVRPNKNGTPPAREVRGAKDIHDASGVKPKLVPVRPLKDQQ